VEAGLTAVCILTGHGLKDPDRAIAESHTPPLIEPTADDIMRAITSASRR
jgi:threonine synthase